MSNFFKDKTILITGWTGFIWQSLCKYLLNQEPASIRLFSRDEVKHYNVWTMFNNNRILRHLIWDVRDEARLVKAMQWVDYVIHAAAMKRLDMIEYNTEESVHTNIIWAMNVISAAMKNNVKKVVNISSDKACSPVNTYGACKFVWERIFTECNFSNGDKWKIFTTVRYGNVLNSTWSIVPLLKNKIINNEPFYLTHPKMTRFLITSEQAVELILKAFELTVWGEVFVPRLPSCNIIDLMEAIKKVNWANNKIERMPVRPGEKMHELMINKVEWQRTLEYDNLYVIKSLLWVLDPEAVYFKNWKEVQMDYFSSEDTTISVDEIIEIFWDELKI